VSVRQITAFWVLAAIGIALGAALGGPSARVQGGFLGGAFGVTVWRLRWVPAGFVPRGPSAVARNAMGRIYGSPRDLARAMVFTFAGAIAGAVLGTIAISVAGEAGLPALLVLPFVGAVVGWLLWFTRTRRSGGDFPRDHDES